MVWGNRFNGNSQPDVSESGVSVTLSSSGTSAVSIQSNVFSTVASCDCGNAAAIAVRGHGGQDSLVGIFNNTFDAVPNSGRGIYVDSPELGKSMLLQIKNNVLSDVGGRPVRIGGPFETVDFEADGNVIYNAGDSAIWNGHDPGQVFTFAPGYLDAAAGDYRPRLGSPLIDRGATWTDLTFAEADASLNERLAGAAWDIGAYEAAGGDNRPRAAFVHQSTAENVQSYTSRIDHRLLNDNPSAIPFVSRRSGTLAEAKPIGMFYSTGSDRWQIFNEDLSPMASGQSFNVVVPPTDATAFVHKATVANTTGEVSYINHPALGDAFRRVLITQSYNPTPGTIGYNDTEVTAYWDIWLGAWGVSNEDGSSMPAGLGFHVWVLDHDADAIALSEAQPVPGHPDTVELSHPALNDRPDAILVSSHAWNIDGILASTNTNTEVAEYDPATGRWTLRSIDGGNVNLKSFLVLVASPIFASDFEAGDAGGWSMVAL